MTPRLRHPAGALGRCLSERKTLPAQPSAVLSEIIQYINHFPRKTSDKPHSEAETGDPSPY